LLNRIIARLRTGEHSASSNIHKFIYALKLLGADTLFQERLIRTMTVPVIGFVGTGRMGQLAHLANYVQLRDAGECEIAGVTDLKLSLARAVAEKYRIQRVYQSTAELLDDPSVDAVVCIQQWPNNYALVKQILSAGKSVLTEKPMVGRLDEAEELTAVAHKQQLLYAVGFMKRYDTGVELARDLLEEPGDSGDLGPLLSVDLLCNGGDWLHNVEAPVQVEDPTPVPPLHPTYPDACQTPQQRAAYGYLLNIFSHNINLCHYLLNAELEPRFAQFHRQHALNACLRCGDVLVSVRGAHSENYKWQEQTMLTFARGQMVIETPTPMNRQQLARVTLVRKGRRAFATTHYHPPIEWAFLRQARGFVRALAGQEALRAPAEICLWDVRVMQRLIEIAEVF
jgi:predicted dehydrogenase